MDEAAHRSDALLRQICLRLATGIVALLPDAVNLLVHFGTVEVTVLTSTGHRGGDAGRMPRPDTGHLTQPTVGLRGRRVTPQRVVTPSYPCPLVTPRTSTSSSLAKTESMVTSFSNRLLAKSTLAWASAPPLIWTSMMCAFFTRVELL